VEQTSNTSYLLIYLRTDRRTNRQTELRWLRRAKAVAALAAFALKNAYVRQMQLNIGTTGWAKKPDLFER